MRSSVIKQRQQCLREVEAFCRGLPPKISPAWSRRYHGGEESSFEFLGLSVPQMRSLFIAGKEHVAALHLSPAQQTDLWDYVWWHSTVYEVLCAPLFFLGQRSVAKEPFQYWPTAQHWATKVENWVHSDNLCSFYTNCLYANPSAVYPQLVSWNESDNPWLQRISIVSLLYYSRQRKEVLPVEEMIPLVDRLVDSSHPYVQKGVGWTLREIGNVYPRQTYDYLNRNVLRLAPVSYSYATEKLDPLKKERLAIKRKHRKVS